MPLLLNSAASARVGDNYKTCLPTIGLSLWGIWGFPCAFLESFFPSMPCTLKWRRRKTNPSKRCVISTPGWVAPRFSRQSKHKREQCKIISPDNDPLESGRSAVENIPQRMTILLIYFRYRYIKWTTATRIPSFPPWILWVCPPWILCSSRWKQFEIFFLQIRHWIRACRTASWKGLLVQHSEQYLWNRFLHLCFNYR